ncbi:hypothetical protein MARINOS108_11225 [Marinoscillum sp. 108]|nr:hypothetical protein MARINOS108_11225 [Marinoscillum sp. 108]
MDSFGVQMLIDRSDYADRKGFGERIMPSAGALMVSVCCFY